MWLSAGGLDFGVAGDRGCWCPEEYYQSFSVSNILYPTTGLPASSSSFLSLSACHPFFSSGLNIVPLPTGCYICSWFLSFPALWCIRRDWGLHILSLCSPLAHFFVCFILCFWIYCELKWEGSHWDPILLFSNKREVSSNSIICHSDC